MTGRRIENPNALPRSAEREDAGTRLPAADLEPGRFGGPRAPIRTLRVLEVIADASEGVSLARLSHALEVPKTSLFSLLRSLSTQGYVLQMEGRYILGPATIRLSMRASRNSSFMRAIRPALEQCSARLNETVAFVMLDEAEFRVEYVDIIECNRSVRYVVHPGDVRPLYCTAGGLAILAWQQPEQIARYLDTVERTRVTAATVIAKSGILKRLGAIRRDGLCTTIGEYSEEVCGFAAPVFCRPGVAFGAMVAGAPMSRAFRAKKTYGAIVKEAAQSLSAELVATATPTAVRC